MTDEELRERLAAALWKAGSPLPWEGLSDRPTRNAYRAHAAALLPEVKRYAAQQLREAADDADMSHPMLGPGVRCERLRDRADTLAATTTAATSEAAPSTQTTAATSEETLP